jgi:hypothetical protein
MYVIINTYIIKKHMRKITQEACTAFRDGYTYLNGNTQVGTNEHDGILENDMVMELHGNKIAQHINGTLYISLCGWNTNTTRERLNGIDGVSVTTKNGQAYLNGYKWNGDMVNPHTFTGNVSDTDTEKRNALKKKIAEYSKLYVHPYEKPSNGDCLFCQFYDSKTGATMGDASGRHEHLVEHIKEPYVHGSLMYNALKEYGIDDMRMGVWFSMDNNDESVQRAIRKYLQKRLIP